MHPFVPESPDLRKESGSRRWLDLIEQIVVCARLLRSGAARPVCDGDLSDAQLSVLWGVYSHAELAVSQNQLAAALAISSAHVSGLVEQLRGRGLLIGHRPAPDRRCQSWRLTELGRETLAAVLADMAGWAGTMDRRIPPERSEALARLLDEVCRILRAPGSREVDLPEGEYGEAAA